MKAISILWRLFATSTLFISFAIGAVILVGIFVPFIKLFSKAKQKVIAQFLIFISFKKLVIAMKLLGVARFHFQGFEQLKKDKGTLFIANHPSLIDYVIITSQLPRCNNIVKTAITDNWLLKHLVLAAGYIPNYTNEKTLKEIEQVQKQGENLLIFPEGTRTPADNKIKIKRGAAQLSIRFQMPVRLIHIKCAPRTLTKNEKWYKIPPMRVRFDIIVGEKIDPACFLDQSAYPSIAARKLTAYIEKQLTNGSTV